MNYEVDARGYTNPYPVIQTKTALDSARPGDTVKVIVDSENIIQSLKKMAITKNYTIQYSGREGFDFVIIIGKTASDGGDTVDSAFLDDETDDDDIGSVEKGLLVMISSDSIGDSEEGFGQQLMNSYIFALSKQNKVPETIILNNSAVKLSTINEDTVNHLKSMATAGTNVFSGAASLSHYGLTGKAQVGMVANIYDMVEMMEKATKVIKL